MKPGQRVFHRREYQVSIPRKGLGFLKLCFCILACLTIICFNPSEGIRFFETPRLATNCTQLYKPGFNPSEGIRFFETHLQFTWQEVEISFNPSEGIRFFETFYLTDCGLDSQVSIPRKGLGFLKHRLFSSGIDIISFQSLGRD